MLIPGYEAPLPPFFIFQNKCIARIFFQLGYGVILENKKRKERSFINWNEHQETKNARIGTKTVLRVKKILFTFDLIEGQLKNENELKVKIMFFFLKKR